MVTESQHIDYHFSGLEDDDGDDEIENNENDGSEVHDDGELSFEYRVNDKDQDADSSAGGSSELGNSDITFPQIGGPYTAQENEEGNYRKSHSFRRDVRAVSQSAPLFPRTAQLLLQKSCYGCDQL